MIPILGFLLAAQSLGQQVSPNPNPAGNQIELNGSGWYSLGAFQNDGSLIIHGPGSNSDGPIAEFSNGLNNTEASVLTSTGVVTNYGTVVNYELGELRNFGGTVSNNGYWRNRGKTIFWGTNENNGTFENSGTFETEDYSSSFKNNGELNNSGSYSGGLENNGSFRNSGTLLSNSPGIGTVKNYGIIENFGSIGSGDHLSAGWYNLANYGAFQNQGFAKLSVNSWSGASIENHQDGALLFNGGGPGTITNWGTAVNVGYSGGGVINHGSLLSTWTLDGYIENNGTFTNDGTYTAYEDVEFLGRQFLNKNLLINNNIFVGRGNTDNEGTIDNLGILQIWQDDFYSQGHYKLDNSGIINNKSEVQGHGGTDAGSIYNSGLITNSGTFRAGTLSNHGTIINTGEFFISSRNSNNGSNGTAIDGTNHGEFINSVGGNLYIQSFYNAGTLLNDGTAVNSGFVSNNGELVNNNTFENHGWIENNGVIRNNGTFTNYSRITGSGEIFGDVTDYGEIAPGNSPGVLTINGNLDKNSGAPIGLQIEIGGVFDGGGNKSLTEFDWLDITGNLQLAGTLQVIMWNGFQLVDGLSFKIINVGGILSGQFDGLAEGGKVGTFGNADLLITYSGGDGNDVVLYSVSSVPEPGSVGLIFAISAAGALLHRGRRSCPGNSSAA